MELPWGTATNQGAVTPSRHTAFAAAAAGRAGARRSHSKATELRGHRCRTTTTAAFSQSGAAAAIAARAVPRLRAAAAPLLPAVGSLSVGDQRLAASLQAALGAPLPV